MKPAPMVSVHMITYNHAGLVRRAIESVVTQQTEHSFELIIGEDSSDDGTREIVREYQARYPDVIRVVTSEERVGMRLNSNRVQAACRGRYVAWCEGDDFWHDPHKLQKQVDYLEHHPECGLVHSDHDRYFLEDGQIVSSFFRATGNVPPPDFNVFRGWNGFHIQTCTAMARRSLIDRVYQDPVLYQNPQYSGAGDIPLFIEISMQAECHYMAESLATYTILPESASRTRDPAKAARFTRANFAARVYLARKYGKPAEHAYFMDLLHNANSWVAFFDRDAELARAAWRAKPWSPKALILYLGAMSSSLRSMIVPAAARLHDFRYRRTRYRSAAQLRGSCE